MVNTWLGIGTSTQTLFLMAEYRTASSFGTTMKKKNAFEIQVLMADKYDAMLKFGTPSYFGSYILTWSKDVETVSLCFLEVGVYLQ